MTKFLMNSTPVLRLKTAAMRLLIKGPFTFIRRFRDSKPYYSQPGMREFWRKFPNSPSNKARVVVYGLRTYERSDLAVFEKVLSDALRHRGASVYNLLCGGLLSSCDGASNPEPHGPLCTVCRCQRNTFEKLYPNDFLLMAELLKEGDIETARKTAAGVADGDMQGFEFLGVRVGEHAFNSANKYFRNEIQDYTDPRYLHSLRHNLYQAILLVLVAKGLLEKEKPTHFITLHGGYSTWGPISEYLGAHGVSIYIHNKSINRVGCFYITKAGQDLSDIVAKEVWEEARNVPLTPEQKQRLHAHLDSVKGGQTTEYKLYDASKRDDLDPEFARLLHSTDRKKFALYPHLFWDKAFLNRYDSLGGFFKDDIEWMLETIEFFTKQKDSLLFVKPHPGENMAADFTEYGARELIRDHFGKLPDNIVVIDKKCRVKSFDLMDNGCTGVVFTSTSGLEHSFFKKPVLAAGEIHYARAGAALRIKSKQEYFGLLADPKPLYDFPGKNYDTIERYAYYYYFRQQVRIPFYRDDVWLGHCIDWTRLADYAGFIKNDRTMNGVAEAIVGRHHVMSLD